MTLKEVSEVTQIPYSTLAYWNRCSDYKKSLINFLKASDRSVLLMYFQEKSHSKKGAKISIYNFIF